MSAPREDRRTGLTISLAFQKADVGPTGAKGGLPPSASG